MCLEWRIDCHRNHVWRKNRGVTHLIRRTFHFPSPRALEIGKSWLWQHPDRPLLLLLLLGVAAGGVHPRLGGGRHDVGLRGSSC